MVVALLGGVVDVWRAANAAEGGGGVRQSRREVATAGLVPAGGVTERAAPVEEVPEDVSSSYTRQAASWMRCTITLKLFVLEVKNKTKKCEACCENHEYAIQACSASKARRMPFMIRRFTPFITCWLGPI